MKASAYELGKLLHVITEVRKNIIIAFMLIRIVIDSKELASEGMLIIDDRAGIQDYELEQSI